jgi:hypothetical protein
MSMGPEPIAGAAIGAAAEHKTRSSPRRRIVAKPDANAKKV